MYKAFYSRKSLLPILFLLLPTIGYSQIEWTQRISSAGASDITEQHAIYNGDIFACGYFEGTITIGGITLVSRGESDIFLYRTTSDGTIVWAKSLGGPNYDGDVGLGIDAHGNIYLAGGFIKELIMDNSTLVSAKPGNDYWNSFIAKFDENGNIIWTKGILAESNYSEVRVWGNISVGNDGFVVAASFSGSISVDGSLIPGSTSIGSMLIASFDLDGNVNWTKVPPGVTTCSKIHVDESGSLILTGPFTNTIQFDSYSLTSRVSGQSDIYLVKLDGSGYTQWLSGGIKTTDRIDNNWSTSFTLDPAGHIYLVGIFKGDVSFYPFTLHGNTDPEYSITDSFLVEYSAGGVVLDAINFGDSFHAFVTDITYTPEGLFLSGTSNAHFFYSIMPTNSSISLGPFYVDSYGILGEFSVFDEKTIYISGFASYVNGEASKGGQDGVLMKIKICLAANPLQLTAINGASSICPSEQTTYSVDIIGEAKQFLWKIPSVFSPYGDIYSNSPEIVLNASSQGHSSIWVYTLNECDQKTDSLSIDIAVSEILTKPEIIRSPCDRELSILEGENIEWYKNDVLLPAFVDKTIHILASGAYKVKINNYCTSAESDEVIVDPVTDRDDLFFPNVITPGDNSKNESFCVENSLLNSHLKIFNRWGGLVYESIAYDNSWKGENASSGMYYYYLKNSCLTKPYKGTIQVIK